MVKTRCTPPCSPIQAADLAAAALADTLSVVDRTAADRRVIALEGQPGPWLPERFEVIAQGSGSLGERIDRVMRSVGGACLLIGMDTPQVTAEPLDDALRRLRSGIDDAVVGASTDGGFWAIGIGAAAAPVGDLCASVPMSLPSTGDMLRDRLSELGLAFSMLETLTDFDDFATAMLVAAAIPTSRFARTVDATAAAIKAVEAGAA